MSRPLVVLTLCLISGIIFGHYLSLPISLLIIFSILLLLAATILISKQKDISIVLLFLSFLSGIILIEHHESSQQRLLSQVEAIAQSSPLELTGRVVDSSNQSKGMVNLTLDEVRLAYQGYWYNYQGKILVNYSAGSTNPIYYFGDRIRGYGILNSAPELLNPDEFNYRDYLVQYGIYGIFHCWQTSDVQIYQVQRRTIAEHILRFASKINQYFVSVNFASLPPIHAALLNGIVLGEKSELTDDIKDSFIRCGIFHLLVVSGSNVMLVAFIVYIFLKLFRIKRKVAAIVSIPLIILYALVAGYQPPVSRATIMAILVLLGIALKQDDQIINNIGIAALIALLFNPTDVFNASFQLSFLTILSIVLIYPILKSWYTFPKRLSFIQIVLYGSITALIGILPLSAYYFNIISFISPTTNLIAGPIVSIILPAGFLTGFIHPLSPSIAQLVANTNWLLLTILIKSVQFLYYIPGSYIYIGKPALWLVAVYYILLLGFIYSFYPTESAPNYGLRKKWLLATTSFILIFFILTSFQPWNRTLTMTLLSIGQGDSTFIEFPNHRTLLVDGGDYSNGKRILVPYLRRLGVNRIDTVILSHPHNDHVGGLVHILNNFSVAQVIDSRQSQYDPEYYPEFCSLIQQKHIVWQKVSRGENIDLYSGATIRIINPLLQTQTKVGFDRQDSSSSGVNNNSIVFQLIYGRVTALFAGDIEQETEKELVQTHIPLGATLFKVPHHGSAASSEISFLHSVHPQVAIISVGSNNWFNLPSPETIAKLNTLHSQVYRTDQDGAIIMQTDGNKIELTKPNSHK
jgi:competence protein ComEC